MLEKIPSQKLRSNNGNIFNITKAESYSCFIEKYSAGHSQLHIKVFKGNYSAESAITIVFGGVHYFQGPTTWKGLIFTVNDSTALLEFLHGLGMIPDVKDDYFNFLTEELHLFTLQLPKSEVKILATSVHISGSSGSTAKS